MVASSSVRRVVVVVVVQSYLEAICGGDGGSGGDPNERVNAPLFSLYLYFEQLLFLPPILLLLLACGTLSTHR